MVEEAGAIGALVTVNQSPRSDAAASAEWSKCWKVEFSRFFHFPKVSLDLLASRGRKPIYKIKSYGGGTWLTASSQAVLRIARHRADIDPVISVSLRGTMLEEHCISSLSILWPQVSCASECPTRGSCVVFFSYIGSSSQTEKFAVRFNTSLMQDFLETIENISINERPVGAILFEDPATSDQIGSNRPENRSVDQSGSSNPPSPYTPALPVLYITDHESRYSPQQFLQDDMDAFSGMPPSFQELLNECSLQIGAGSDRADMNTEKIQSKSPLRDSLNADSVDDFLTSLEELMLTSDADLKSQVEKCLADTSFRGCRGGVVAKIKGLILITFASLDVSCGGYDLLADHLHMFFNLPDILAKIETVIDELGGESAQPI